MARIQGTIPQQNFELVRDRIGEIITDELESQVLFYNPDLDATVYVERTDPIDKTELPVVIVSLATGNYDNKDVKSTDGTYTYNVDVFTRAKTSADQEGDQRSMFSLHRLLGVIRYILDNPIYKTLGFANPMISRVAVQSLNIAEPGKQDAASVMMGRLTVTVRVPETVNLLPASLLAGYETSVKLQLTDKGYVFTKL